MDRYFKRKSMLGEPSDSRQLTSCENEQIQLKHGRIEFDLENLPADPGDRKKISDYHPNDRDRVRRAYLLKGPCQPHNHDFPQREFGNLYRRFNPEWFTEYESWLEYSIKKDAAYCLCCYLFKADIGNQAGGDAFVKEGFSSWNKKKRLDIHVGGPNSAHNQAWKKCQDLLKQDRHIQTHLNRQSEQVRKDYRTRLTASVDCTRFLLQQGLAFRGHDESKNSHNQGNFLELLQFLADHNEDIKKVALNNAQGNLRLTSHDIQTDIVNAAASETTQFIINDLGDEFFAILVDESRDISFKEQMAIVLRYVDKRGHIVERFLGIVHVSDTSAISLKEAIEGVLIKHGLSMSKIRGQGYDGASNMRGEFNGLKSLILQENPCAYYVHCFAHQLQLTLVAVAKKHTHIALLFNVVGNILNVVGASCKRRDILRESQAKKIIEKLSNDDLPSGRGLNQEMGLKRHGDTRWGSHYNTLLNLIVIFSSVIEVLEFVVENGLNSEQRAEACVLVDSMQTFDFAFNLHLMKCILGITNELSQALQKKDQNIVNAMNLVRLSKKRLQRMRDEEWDSLLGEVSSFCVKHNIEILNMDDRFVMRGRSRRNMEQLSNLHHYRVELFYAVIDLQLQELEDRFNEVNTQLLLCVACLDPSNAFSAFDKEKLIRLAEFYPSEFPPEKLMALDNQLETYILDVRQSIEFLNIKGIGDLAEKLVDTKRDTVYRLVYLLIKLALIIPVATATVERAFSAMKIVKNRLRNRMGDGFMNDCLVTYIEKDIFKGVANEKIIQRFQNMSTRRGQL